MTTTKPIGTILTTHGIEWRLEHGRIIVRDVGMQDGEPLDRDVDLTDYTPAQLLAWLGY